MRGLGFMARSNSDNSILPSGDSRVECETGLRWSRGPGSRTGRPLRFSSVERGVYIVGTPDSFADLPHLRVAQHPAHATFQGSFGMHVNVMAAQVRSAREARLAGFKLHDSWTFSGRTAEGNGQNRINAVR